MFFCHFFSTFPWSNAIPEFGMKPKNDGFPWWFPQVDMEPAGFLFQGLTFSVHVSGAKSFFGCKGLSGDDGEKSEHYHVAPGFSDSKKFQHSLMPWNPKATVSWKTRGFVHVSIYYIYLWNIGKHLPKWCDSRIFLLFGDLFGGVFLLTNQKLLKD